MHGAPREVYDGFTVKCITKEEAEILARPRILMPMQQELMDWPYRLYHLSFPKIFWLANSRKNLPPKRAVKMQRNVTTMHCLPIWHGSSSSLADSWKVIWLNSSPRTLSSWRWCFNQSDCLCTAWTHSTNVRLPYKPTHLGLYHIL
jgi:hypothetical protein